MAEAQQKFDISRGSRIRINCAVDGCSNSTYRLYNWRNKFCLEHKKPHYRCSCPEPFQLIPFPTKKNDPNHPSLRNAWARLVNRTFERGKLKGQPWQPNSGSRICSKHFISEEHVYPIIGMGHSNIPDEYKPQQKEGSQTDLPFYSHHELLKVEDEDSLSVTQSTERELKDVNEIMQVDIKRDADEGSNGVFCAEIEREIVKESNRIIHDVINIQPYEYPKRILDDGIKIETVEESNRIIRDGINLQTDEYPKRILLNGIKIETDQESNRMIHIGTKKEAGEHPDRILLDLFKRETDDNPIVIVPDGISKVTGEDHTDRKMHIDTKPYDGQVCFSGVRSFKCSQCEESFPLENLLSDHMTLHDPSHDQSKMVEAQSMKFNTCGAGHGRVCAVVGCRNNSYRLHKWRNEFCSKHQRPHFYCVCPEPFRLIPFPSKKKDPNYPSLRNAWTQLLNRTYKEGKLKGQPWQPNLDSRICSKHFVSFEYELFYPVLHMGNTEIRDECEADKNE